MFEYFAGLSPVILLVVAVLVAFSLVSWAIIVLKFLQSRSVGNSMDRFEAAFWEAEDLGALEAGLGGFEGCPLAVVFEVGCDRTREGRARKPAGAAALAATAGLAATALTRADGTRPGKGLGGAAALAGRLRRAGERESAILSRNLSFLATVGSTAPFIGLFGTVWGIMRAFEGIGRTGSTSLDIVAPGISEALITTAMGLAVAIPAVIGYNFLQRRIKALTERIDSFAYDLGAILHGDLERGD